MKMHTYIALALVMVLSLTQCKKDQPKPQSDKVYITLKVKNGTKHEVLPNTGIVKYGTGDVIYVGNGSHFIGYLTCSGSVFGGIIDVTGMEEYSSYLHFYFAGGVGPDPAGLTTSTTDFTISISDQSSQLPVLSYTSTEYVGGTSYQCTLEHKCGLVKLTLSNPYGIVKLGNRYTTATIDFASPGITHSGSADGQVTFYSASSTEKWAILLPQDADATSNNVTVGASNYTVSVPAIENNSYVTGIDPIENDVVSHNIDLSTLTGNYEVIDGDILTGTLSDNYKISISTGATVTLDGASINAFGSMTTGDYAGITCNGDATIILKDGSTNAVNGFNEDYPGIYVPAGSTLTIKGETSGTGVLFASSNDDGNYSGAGIGGGWNLACGNIVIQSGVIDATGSTNAAGIGSNNMACGNITISGGTVTATGGKKAAGIGGGFGGGCGDITIASTVTRVTAIKGLDALHSIGRGRTGPIGTVTIGGVVTGAISTSPYIYPVPGTIN